MYCIYTHCYIVIVKITCTSCMTSIQNLRNFIKIKVKINILKESNIYIKRNNFVQFLDVHSRAIF